jgi:phenylacetate-CoA ligase
MNPLLVRKILFPVYRSLKRDNVLGYVAEMRSVQALDPDQVREYQWRKLKEMLEYASKHVPYYRGMFKSLGASPKDFRSQEDFKSLPILRKQDIRDNADALISETYPGKLLDSESTGGSTGKNLYFWVGREASEARRANTIRMNEWIDISIGDREAFLWGTAFEVGRWEKLVNAVKSRVSNRLVLSAYRMDDATLASYVERLRKYKPHVMWGYPSALTYFSQEVMAKAMDGIRPRAVVLSGETLYDWQRQVIEKAFGVKAYNHYGCREFGAIARECKMRNGLHIACERVYLEMVEVADSANGTKATELVVTDLHSFGMPFIRYAIEDMGTITWERCRCGLGLPRLETTIGRTFDVVRAPNGNFLGGTFWTILLRKRKGIDRFQVIQEREDEITIALVPAGDFTDETRRYITEKVQEACGDKMRVRFELKPTLEATPSGKYRFVISKIGLQDQARGEAADASAVP